MFRYSSFLRIINNMLTCLYCHTLLLCYRRYLDLVSSDGHNIQLHAPALPTLTHVRMYMRYKVNIHRFHKMQSQ